MKSLLVLILAVAALGQAPAYDPHDLSGIWWARTARGTNFSLSATGTSSANGTLKTLVVDRVATKLPAFSNMSMAIGARGACRSG